jgi:hypothetical protein
MRNCVSWGWVPMSSLRYVLFLTVTFLMASQVGYSGDFRQGTVESQADLNKLVASLILKVPAGQSRTMVTCDCQDGKVAVVYSTVSGVSDNLVRERCLRLAERTHGGCVTRPVVQPLKAIAKPSTRTYSSTYGLPKEGSSLISPRTITTPRAYRRTPKT